VLYVVPPFVIAYSAMNWAVEKYVNRPHDNCCVFLAAGVCYVWIAVLMVIRNEYLNSKPGRLAEGGHE
jgi:hypothetical protein